MRNTRSLKNEHPLSFDMVCKLRVLTWNIMVDDYNPLRYQRMTEMIEQLFKTDQVDIVCLQEVSVLACSYILSMDSPVAHLYHPLEANSSFRTYGEAILFNKEKLVLIDKGFFLLPSRQGRGVQWGQFKPQTQPYVDTFTIATAHLESKQENVDLRTKQLETIQEKFDITDVILLGDFNMTETEHQMVTLQPDTGQTYQYGDTYYARRFCHGNSSHPYDRVWTNCHIVPRLVTRFGFDSNSGLDISNHDGLIVELKFIAPVQ